MPSLLSRSTTKRFIIKRFGELRAGPSMTRVSQRYLDELEAWLKNKIISDIQKHPSIGKTFRP